MTVFSTISDVLSSKNIGLGDALVHHAGLFDEKTIDQIAKQIEEAIKSGLISRAISKKVFNISIEISQNLFHYLSKGELPANYATGFFSLYYSEQGIYITSGNFIKQSEVSTIVRYIETINNLSKDGLKTLYREVLDKGELSDQGGAGLGFIDIVRKSGNKIDYTLIEVNEDFSFLVIKAHIYE